jgi:fibronectin-binding autotransporter adhesin
MFGSSRLRRNKRKTASGQRRFTMGRGLRFEGLEVRHLLSTVTWVGDNSNYWGDALNWSPEGNLSASDDLVFPANAQRKTIVNNFPAGTQFHSITISGSDYGISGNQLRLGSGGLAATYASGDSYLDTPLSLDSGTAYAIQCSTDGSLRLRGEIGGSGGFSKSGGGTLTLSGSNTFSGGTTINAGVVQFNSAGAMGNGSGVTVNAGAVAAAGYAIDQPFLNRIQSSSTGIVGLACDSSNPLSFSTANLPNVALGATGNFTYGGLLSPSSSTYYWLGGGNGTLTLNHTNALTGAANRLVVVGSVVLAASNDFGAGTFINNGTLHLGVNNALPTNGLLSMASWTAFDLNGYSQQLGTFQGGGSVTLGSGTLTVGSGTFSGTISGTGALVKTGAGTFTLSGSNTFTGGTTINAGVVQFNSVGAMGNGSAVTLNAYAMAAAGYAIDQPFLDRINSSSTGVVGLACYSSNALSFAALPNVSLGATGNFTYGGVLTPNSSNYYWLGGGNGTLTLNHTNALTGAANRLVVVGSVVLAASNDFGVGTFINNGTLHLGVNNALPTNGLLSMASWTAFDLNGYSQQLGTFQGGGSVTLGSGTLTVGSGTFSGTISGSGALLKTGAGTFTLSGSSTFTGGTTVNGGTLQAGAAGALSATSSVSLTSGATLNLNGYSQQIASLSGSGTVSLGSGTLTVGSDSFAGTISGTGGVGKTTTGTLTLSGSNS